MTTKYFDKNPVSGYPPTKETGFLPNLRVLMGDFSTKTGFLANRQLKKPGFLLNLPVATKYFVKKPGF
ncbi:MAG: hypothetical protein WCD53_27970 [Microcoleus sp.]